MKRFNSVIKYIKNRKNQETNMIGVNNHDLHEDVVSVGVWSQNGRWKDIEIGF